MATTKKVEAPETEVQPDVQETEYTVSEYANYAEKVFGVGITPDIVTAAFAVNNLTSATKKKAKEIVVAFAKKEVSK